MARGVPRLERRRSIRARDQCGQLRVYRNRRRGCGYRISASQRQCDGEQQQNSGRILTHHEAVE